MRDEIINFLLNLAEKMKQKTLSDEEEKQVSEFYMSFSFLQTLPISQDKDMIKYMALGWHIYNNLQQEKIDNTAFSE